MKKGQIMSQEQKDKISKANSGENHWLYGKHMSEEQKTKISNTLKGATHGYKKGCISGFAGNKHSKKSNIKNAESNKGKRRSPSTEFKEGHIPWNTGKKMSKEFIQNMKERISDFNGWHGRKGTDKHIYLIEKTAEILRDYSNDVEIEKRVVMGSGKWRYIDILVDGKICYEIGYCKKNKKMDLINNGYEVIHLPYNVLEGW